MSELTFYKRRRGFSKKIIKEIFIWLLGIIISAGLGIGVVMGFAIRTHQIGDSMSPTIKNGETVLLNKVAYILGSPARGDIIVYLPNGNTNGHTYIRRVIGIPGDKVIIKNGSVYVNDNLLDDDFSNIQIEDAGIADEEITVGKDEYFVLGDNRNSGEDSRYVSNGNIKKKFIIGKAWFLANPFSHFGFL
ncbi:signal peptidase I [Acetitomaculum ruminis DSM 5522]|uniref:Signal peptidase I n=1 Tax=Acetitomaculum ruminis DSM 5522 TaxID=1120918 RepID=A0A1I0VPT8_9FIRM|nr:signal peptidase I [Acetitomaculum ruminis]SFA78047.1 signal peptidase I [Acetitomaculum ruminis DSM 5522]